MDWSLPLCRINDDLYIGAFVILGQPKLSEHCARELLKIVPEYDYIITAEAKGIPLAADMARLAGDDCYFVARKKKKLYMTGYFESTLHSITTESTQTLILDTADADKMRGKRILIVDDVVSTGESLAAIEQLVNKAGGNIIGKAAILVEGDAQARGDVIYLEELPLFNPDGTIKE